MGIGLAEKPMTWELLPERELHFGAIHRRLSDAPTGNLHVS